MHKDDCNGCDLHWIIVTLESGIMNHNEMLTFLKWQGNRMRGDSRFRNPNYALAYWRKNVMPEN